jgi:hypothetical protein
MKAPVAGHLKIFFRDHGGLPGSTQDKKFR